VSREELAAFARQAMVLVRANDDHDDDLAEWDREVSL
jgi:hypothetical protein